MSALYLLRYLDRPDIGFGCLYIGKGLVLGVDPSAARYHGTYARHADRIELSIMLLAPHGGTVLATGERLHTRQAVPLTADWPAGFADGSARQILMIDQPVRVSLEKIGDIP